MLKGDDQSQDFLLRVINPDTEPDACLQSEFGMEYLGTVMPGSDAICIPCVNHEDCGAACVSLPC